MQVASTFVLATALFLAHIGGAAPPDAAGAAALAALRTQLLAARRAPSDRAALQGLAEGLKTAADENVRECLSCAVALGALLQGGSVEAFELQRTKLSRQDASARAQILDDANLRGPCPDCGGSRVAEAKCAACGGSGKCTNSKCKGGKVNYKVAKGIIERRCPICSGSGKCIKCKGSGHVERRCAACGGTGSRLASQKVEAAFLQALDLTMQAIGDGERGGRPAASSPAATEAAGGAAASGHAVTPEHLKPVVVEFGQWLEQQQRRLGVRIATTVYAEAADGTAVLHIVMHENFREQDQDWRQQVGEACREAWVLRCQQPSIAARIRGMAVVLQDAEGKVIGKGAAEVGSTWVEP